VKPKWKTLKHKNHSEMFCKMNQVVKTIRYLILISVKGPPKCKTLWMESASGQDLNKTQLNIYGCCDLAYCLYVLCSEIENNTTQLFFSYKIARKVWDMCDRWVYYRKMKMRVGNEIGKGKTNSEI